MPVPELQIRTVNDGEVRPTQGGWRLSIPAGEVGSYRLAQLDDYGALGRGEFPHRPPLTLSLRARASAAVSPGTWGFGLWNEPLSASLGFGSRRILPALPQAAWFFFAAPQNHLALRDGLPGQGRLAASYRSVNIPTLLLAPGVLALPLLAFKAGSRALRRLAAGMMREQVASLSIDATQWHEYALIWRRDGLDFYVDEQLVLESDAPPHGPLGLVIWLDNQFAAWAPDGRIGYGTLPNPAAWIDIADLEITE